MMGLYEFLILICDVGAGICCKPSSFRNATGPHHTTPQPLPHSSIRYEEPSPQYLSIYAMRWVKFITYLEYYVLLAELSYIREFNLRG